MSKRSTPPTTETKSATISRLLSRKTGADMKALQDATGWQAHSVRAALSGLRKAGYRVDRFPPKKDGAATTYRIMAVPETA